MLGIDFREILSGTYQILVFYLIIAAIVIVLFLLIKKFDSFLLNLDKIHVKNEPKHKRLFKLNYIVYFGFYCVIITAIILISLLNFRSNQEFFVFFGFFSFIALPVALGCLTLYTKILKEGEYRLGPSLFLLISGIMFALFGANLHDVIWCGMVTDWFKVKRLGGYDLQLFFTIFHIFDRNMWDYRTFGIYMIFKAGIECLVATLSFNLFFILQRKRGTEYWNVKKRGTITYLIMLFSGILFGIIEYSFDSPWNFTNIQYYLILYIGMSLVVVLFSISGYILAFSQKISTKTTIKGELTEKIKNKIEKDNGKETEKQTDKETRKDIKNE